MDLVVAYDIATVSTKDERRLRRVAKICEGYGVRIQDSVFECRLSHAGFEQLVIDLDDAIEPDRDSICVYRIVAGLKDARLTLGKRYDHQFGTPWLL